MVLKIYLAPSKVDGCSKQPHTGTLLKNKSKINSSRWADFLAVHRLVMLPGWKERFINK